MEPMETNNTTEIKYRPFKLRDILFSFLFFAWSQIALTGILYITTLANSGTPSFANLSGPQAALVLTILLMIGNAAVMLKTYNIIKRSMELGEDPAPPIRFKEVGVILAILFAMYFATLLVTNITGYKSTDNQDAINQLFSIAPVLTLIHLIIIAPVCEDMCFRYYLVRPGKVWWPRYIGASLLFLAIHVTGDNVLIETILYSMPVLFLHGTRLLFHSVRYSMLLHIIYNSAVAIIMCINFYA